jgi:predicted TPR repeat methyltransferase
VGSDFDEKARTWDDDPAKVDRAKVVAEAIRETIPLAASTRLLEYGAGTGLVSQSLADHVGSVTLAEPSAGMRAVMHDKVAAGSLPPDARIWDLDLSTGETPTDRFDLVVTVMTLHHIPNLEPVLTGFASLLGDGGDLCVVDLEREDGSFHSSDVDFDGHHGFDRTALAAQLEAAGFTDVRFQPCYEIEKEGGRFPLFLARCALHVR